ncbi:conserved hypothetical protein CHP02452 [Kipferlia bialata]|uniref:Microbial-type PARG catalytic domain-containing protein n=1 Tax=Kipferlia bialata TaxID=797122 RepID=A0A9K3CXX3_9EUKA|nr:conserved hypothetical protein CHP02452 [Kipferlia bialata]|eukprot:g5931.t1
MNVIDLAKQVEGLKMELEAVQTRLELAQAEKETVQAERETVQALLGKARAELDVLSTQLTQHSKAETDRAAAALSLQRQVEIERDRDSLLAKISRCASIQASMQQQINRLTEERDAAVLRMTEEWRRRKAQTRADCNQMISAAEAQCHELERVQREREAQHREDMAKREREVRERETAVADTLSDMQTRHRGELEGAEEEKAQAVTDALEAESAAHAKALAELESTHLSAMQIRETEFMATLDSIKAQLAEAADPSEGVVAIEERHQGEVSALRGEMEILKAQHLIALTSLEEAHAAGIKETQMILRETAERLQTELASTQHSHSKTLTTLQTQHQGVLDAMQQQLEEAKTKSNTVSAEAAQRWEREREALADAHAAEVSTLNAAMADAERESQARHADALAGLNKAHSTVRDGLVAEAARVAGVHAQAMIDMAETHAARVREMQEEHASVVAELTQRLETERGGTEKDTPSDMGETPLTEPSEAGCVSTTDQPQPDETEADAEAEVEAEAEAEAEAGGDEVSESDSLKSAVSSAPTDMGTHTDRDGEEAASAELSLRVALLEQTLHTCMTERDTLQSQLTALVEKTTGEGGGDAAATAERQSQQVAEVEAVMERERVAYAERQAEVDREQRSRDSQWHQTIETYKVELDNMRRQHRAALTSVDSRWQKSLSDMNGTYAIAQAKDKTRIQTLERAVQEEREAREALTKGKRDRRNNNNKDDNRVAAQATPLGSVWEAVPPKVKRREKGGDTQRQQGERQVGRERVGKKDRAPSDSLAVMPGRMPRGVSTVSEVHASKVAPWGWDTRPVLRVLKGERLTDRHRVFVQAHTLARVKDQHLTVDGVQHTIPPPGSTVEYSSRHLFGLSLKVKAPRHPAKVCVVESDSLDAVLQVIQDKRVAPAQTGRVAVLNFANETKPGGGYLNGRGAQEEEIFRRTTLVRSLNSSSVTDEGTLIHYPWCDRQGGEGADVIVSEGVSIIRMSSASGYALMAPVPVTVISTAAPQDPSTVMSSEPGMGLVYAQDTEAHTLVTRIHAVLRAAVLHGVHHLVLGALGCGAFHNPPREVVAVFRELLPSYLPFFRSVTFAVLGDRKGENLPAFRTLDDVIAARGVGTHMLPVCMGECTDPTCHDTETWHPRLCGHRDASSCAHYESAVHRVLFRHHHLTDTDSVTTYGDVERVPLEGVSLEPGLPMCWYAKGCSKCHDIHQRDPDHMASYRHMCPYGMHCTSTDPTHHARHVMDVPDVCWHGSQCTETDDPSHLARFCHWKMDQQE